MDKLKMHTPDLAQENYRKLAALFPNAVTETVDENGEVVRAIDADVLRQEISAAVVEGAQERYQFTWPDKKKSVVLANQPIAKTLRLDRAKSVGRDGTPGSIDTENIYIEGDNLDALKLLQETYLGRVKMIYIDPPYNTGNDFIYEDDFAQETGEYLAGSGQFDAEGNRLVPNTESNGRFHTDWLNMMLPRLRIAKDLLSDDGVVFISIDDNEQENLERICAEVFGSHNFVGCIILQTATDNNPRQINTEHEYILCYAKNKGIQPPWFAESEKAQMIQEKYLELKRDFGDDISTIQTELRIWIKKHAEALQGVTHYDNVDERGVFHDGDIANTVFGGYKYDVIHPVTHKPCKVPEKGYRFSEATMREMVANGDIMFGPDETTLIKPKKRLENAKDVLRSVIYEDGRASTKQFESLMARDIFQNPKSPMILGRLVNFIADDGDIVLDFFSGSGTTAEAVLRLNDKCNKHIKYIMVQIPENLDESYQKADTRAKKTIKNAIRFLDEIKRPHTICEIGEERIRRVGQSIIKRNNPKKDALLLDTEEDVQLFMDIAQHGPEAIERTRSAFKTVDLSNEIDVGFRVFRVDSSNMQDVYYRPEEFTQAQMSLLADNIKPDRTPEDLLFQVMLDLGILLSESIEQTTIAGKSVFRVAGNYLIACFDKNITEEVVTEIAKQTPAYFVTRDSSMASDSLAANFDQIFATYSPATTRKVL